MVHEDNPAGRLHKILSALRAQGNKEISVQTAWSRALNGLEGVDLIVGMQATATMLVDIDNELHGLEGISSVAMYRSYLPRWSKFVGMQTSAKRAQFAPDEVATTDELAMLAGLADLLHLRRVEGKVAEEQVDELLAGLQELISELLAAESLDPDFRAFLLEHLRRAEDALRFFHLYGPARLDEVFGRFFADSMREPEKWADKTDTTWWERTKNLINTLPTLAARLGDVNQIATHAQKLIAMSDGTPPAP